jgi:hypothetical protein
MNQILGNLIEKNMVKELVMKGWLRDLEGERRLSLRDQVRHSLKRQHHDVMK